MDFYYIVEVIGDDMPTVFFSDLHIGDPRSKHASLLDYLRTSKDSIDRVVILGDFLDLWSTSLPMALEESSKFIKFLYDSYGGRVHYVVGNRDSDIMPLKKIFPFVHRSLKFPVGNKIAIGLHGDAINPNAVLKTKMPHYVTWLINRLDGLVNTDVRKSLLSLSEIIDKDPYDQVLRDYESRLIDIFKGKFDYVITGHTHVPCIKKLDSLVYINTGDQVENSTVVIGKPNGFYLYDYMNKKIIDSYRIY